MVPSDVLYDPEQWHFDLIGDIETIWDDYSGLTVHVGVFDDCTGTTSNVARSVRLDDRDGFALRTHTCPYSFML